MMNTANTIKIKKRLQDITALRVTVFFLLVLLIFFFFNALLIPKGVGNMPYSEAMDGFYAEPENTMDVIYMGSSSVFKDISPIYIWSKYGIPGYSRASVLQGPVVTYTLLKDTLEHQKPKVIVADFAWIFDNYDPDSYYANIHMVMDNMPLSDIKMQGITDILSQSKTQTAIDYIFPFLSYHTRWSLLKPRDILSFFNFNKHYPYKGGGLEYNYWPYELDESRVVNTGEKTEYAADSLAYYQKIVDLCQQNGIQLVLLRLPRTDWLYQDYAAIKEFADKNNIAYIDYNMPELMQETGWDPALDMLDHSHLNARGALKITANLGAYLSKNYNLTDKRDDPAYAKWNEDFLSVEDKINSPIVKYDQDTEPDFVPRKRAGN